MKRISLDHEDDRIKNFVRTLPVGPDGVILELNGEPVLRVMPVDKVEVDQERLKQAILRRRNMPHTKHGE